MKPFSAQDVPGSPGVYVFRDRFGSVIYVGKAKNLRRRLSHYFRPGQKRTGDPKLRALIKSIADYEVIEVKSDTEALLLEARLIKQYAPRYNVDMRDDKRYLLVVVDPNEPFPRLRFARLRREDGRIYFGPFPSARVVRQMVHWLARHFRLRTCNVDNPSADTHKHCMESRVRACCCPCVGKTTAEEYHARLQAALDVLRGNTKEVEEALETDMRALADRQQFEQAARLRDVRANLRSMCGRSVRRFARKTLASGGASGEAAVQALAEALGLNNPPRVIECFDISTISGTLSVASLVCFRDGKPSSKDYRRYRIRQVDGVDDFAMMREVVTRRYGRERSETDREYPDLILVDGGVGQLGSAVQALRDEDVRDIPVAGIAKRFETLYLAGRPDPIVLPRHHAGLQLVQHLRDEAHRFAVSYNRTLRRKRIADSVLDDIEGVGPKRREELLKAFRSVARLREASPEEIVARVPRVGRDLAARIHAALHPARTE